MFLPLGAWKFFGLGTIAYIVSSVVLKIFKRDFRFVRTFVHESNHMIFSWLSLRRVSSFMADSEKGGYTVLSGRTNPLIILSPYVVPLLVVPFLILKPIVVASVYPWLTAGVGFAVLFHLHTLCLDLRLRQTDLQKYGYLFSFAFVFWLNSLLVPFVSLGMVFSWERAFDFLLAFPKFLVCRFF